LKWEDYALGHSEHGRCQVMGEKAGYFEMEIMMGVRGRGRGGKLVAQGERGEGGGGRGCSWFLVVGSWFLVLSFLVVDGKGQRSVGTYGLSECLSITFLR